jgi:CubicO group peptidase (beta-lactamase class C family)
VRDTFAENFAHRGELGGACCVYYRGEKVVDLWGGVRDKASGAPWQEDTMVIVYSATKGLAAMTLALAHSRGWLDYEARVARYWPEFAQQGKETLTVRQLLAHQAGLFVLDVPLDVELLADFDRFAAVLARQKPAWPPGTRQAYHAVTLGFYDECMLSDVQFSLGFMKSSPLISFGRELAFGAPGAGGAMGFADPKTGIGYGYVTSQGGTSLTGDPRDVALRNAVHSVI